MIRPERSVESFSRGAELTSAITAMWEHNAAMCGMSAEINATINARIDAIMEEFDLTLQEWHYWCKQLTDH